MKRFFNQSNAKYSRLLHSSYHQNAPDKTPVCLFASRKSLKKGILRCSPCSDSCRKKSIFSFRQADVSSYAFSGTLISQKAGCSWISRSPPAGVNAQPTVRSSSVTTRSSFPRAGFSARAETLLHTTKRTSDRTTAFHRQHTGRILADNPPHGGIRRSPEQDAATARSGNILR